MLKAKMEKKDKKRKLEELKNQIVLLEAEKHDNFESDNTNGHK